MEKSQNGSVKKFANMMVQDHQEFLTKLQKFAPNAGELSRQIDASGRPKDGDRNDLNRDKPNPDRPNANNQDPNNQDPNNRNPNKQNRDRQDDRSLRGTGDSHDTSHVAVKLQREVAQQCLSDAQAKLSKEDGAEFDKCYMGMQIAKHSGMKSKLAVFSRHASDELKQLIDQSLQTTSAHLQEAESIMKELAGESDLPRGERRTGERPTTPAKSEKR